MLAREAKKILCKMTSVYCKHETIFSFPFISSYTRYHYPKIKKKEKESKEKKRRVLKHQQRDVQQIKKGVIICSHICINKCCYSTIMHAILIIETKIPLRVKKSFQRLTRMQRRVILMVVASVSNTLQSCTRRENLEEVGNP